MARLTLSDVASLTDDDRRRLRLVGVRSSSDLRRIGGAALLCDQLARRAGIEKGRLARAVFTVKLAETLRGVGAARANALVASGLSSWVALAVASNDAVAAALAGQGQQASGRSVRTWIARANEELTLEMSAALYYEQKAQQLRRLHRESLAVMAVIVFRIMPATTLGYVFWILLVTGGYCQSWPMLRNYVAVFVLHLLSVEFTCGACVLLLLAALFELHVRVDRALSQKLTKESSREPAFREVERVQDLTNGRIARSAILLCGVMMGSVFVAEMLLYREAAPAVMSSATAMGAVALIIACLLACGAWLAGTQTRSLLGSDRMAERDWQEYIWRSWRAPLVSATLVLLVGVCVCVGATPLIFWTTQHVGDWTANSFVLPVLDAMDRYILAHPGSWPGVHPELSRGYAENLEILTASPPPSS